MYFYTDPLYLILLVPVLLLSLYAQAKVSGNYRKYGQIRNSRGLTGAQAAQEVLRSHGVYDVRIERVAGDLTDHYDPRTNVIRLSNGVYGSPSIAAVGIAAHEAGHAVQYAVHYAPVRLRMAILPATQIGSQFGIIALMLGILLYWEPLFLLGLVLFSLTTVFQLITLPVEFNASRRAMATIRDRDLLSGEEVAGARKVLTAAALTYVAALLMSVLQLLRYIMAFAGSGQRRNGGRR